VNENTTNQLRFFENIPLDTKIVFEETTDEKMHEEGGGNTINVKDLKRDKHKMDMTEHMTEKESNEGRTMDIKDLKKNKEKVIISPYLSIPQT